MVWPQEKTQTERGVHILLIYADDINLLAKSMNTIRRKTDALLPITNEVGLEVIYKEKETGSCLVIRMQGAVMRISQVLKYLR